ncbi:hypothetical protein A1O1_06964 [Capronia coronata CBS 617.96]|uniref:JmjC domain-containing protein n=1 Tax=Capronia coronata CBS 617.96 TaxID=1182541 RepID=W9XT19_9EURO|nr:uncharacterized protein A1O1_06964 [Capronia coronata CBS 617.96]EXJ83343.1 hypothetical protein A1O1_06964 [Capronia coronata CBS 617.96]
MTNSPSKSLAISTLLQLIEDYHAFNPGGVERLPYPTSVEFCKQVSRGRPCVYRLRRSSERINRDRSRNGDRDRDDGRHVNEAPQSDTDQIRQAEETEILSCPAFSWTKEQLCQKVKEDVEVAVTPDGRADSLYPYPYPYPSQSGNPNNSNSNSNASQEGPQAGEDQEESKTRSQHAHEDVFVQPATVMMPLSSVLEKICSASSTPSPSSASATGPPDPTPPSTTATETTNSPHPESREPVYYLQSQNSNLTTTPLAALLADVPSCIPVARPVLGDPEAVNIWMGNASSVTSTHRDPYENLYLVIRGKKHFTLWPPCEELCLHAKKVRTAHHVYDTSTSPPSFKIVLDESPSSTSTSLSEDDDEPGPDTCIPWIPIDPINLPPADILNSQYPYYQYSHPLTVTVSEGEMLYLPSGWFHHVRQDCGVWDDGEVAPCIAVNYWFDMDYEGERYVMREMLARLAEMTREDNQ